MVSKQKNTKHEKQKAMNKKQMVQRAIIDWSSSISKCKHNFTDKCFSRYFYKVIGYNFYDVEVIKSVLPELYKVAKSSSGILYHNGDIVFSEHFGDTKKGREQRISLLNGVYSSILAEEELGILNRMAKYTLDIKDEKGLTKANWEAIYQSYNNIKQAKLKKYAEKLGIEI